MIKKINFRSLTVLDQPGFPITFDQFMNAPYVCKHLVRFIQYLHNPVVDSLSSNKCTVCCRNNFYAHLLALRGNCSPGLKSESLEI